MNINIVKKINIFTTIWVISNWVTEFPRILNFCRRNRISKRQNKLTPVSQFLSLGDSVTATKIIGNYVTNLLGYFVAARICDLICKNPKIKIFWLR